MLVSHATEPTGREGVTVMPGLTNPNYQRKLACYHVTEVGTRTGIQGIHKVPLNNSLLGCPG